ncbi:hypothetical protein WJX72_005675 [[Myrmecia] bisecta]|uniref:Uncharacterized protein n=1 Tax=[Myrmecia] bisecta TaxID=41462 RepID=A0AAW1PBX4_9CHLO
MQSGCIASDDRTHSAKECPDVKATPSPRSQPAGSGKAWHEFVAELNTLSLLAQADLQAAVVGPVSHTTFLAQLSPSKAAPEQPVITSGAQPDSGALPPLTAAAIRAAWGQAGRRLSMTQSGQPTIVVRSSSPQATQKGATTIVVTPPSPSHRPATSQQAPLTPLNSARLRARFATQRPASPTAPPAPSAATSATGRAKAAVGRVPAASVVSAPNAIMADPNSSTATGTAATDDGDRAWALQTELSDDVEPTPGHTFPTPAAAPPEPSPFASAMPATSDGDIARSEGTAAEADNPPSASEGPLATLSPNGGAKRGNGHGRVSDLQERPSKLLRMSRALSINTVLQCVDGQDTKESLGAAVGGAATTVKHKLGESTVELFYMTALVPEKFLEQLPPTLFVSELANRNNVKLGKHYVMRCNLGFMTDKQLHKLTMLANVKLVAVCHLQHCTLTLVPDIHPKNGLRVVGFLLADD